MTKELWEFFLSSLVIFIYHFFLYHFFDFFLCFHVIRVSVSKFGHSFLVSFLFSEMCFQSFTHQFFNFVIVVRFQSGCKIRVILFKVCSLMNIIGPNLLKLSCFSFDLLVLLIMEQLVEHLLEILFWCSDIFTQICKEIRKQVLIRLIQRSTCRSLHESRASS